MSDEDELRFVVVREGVEEAPSKHFTLKAGSETPVRIGRAPGNDIVVDCRSVTQYHTELRYLRVEGGSSVLCVRDLSMNGTGVKRPDGKAVHLDKRVDVPITNGTVLLVPRLLKVTQSPLDRAWLRVDIQAPVARRGPVDEGDVEKRRLRFVELLLKTREVSAGTSYEEAKRLLCTSPDWHAVDETMRKECFEIFVEHLGSHQSQKRKEKRSKEKAEKDESKRQRHREEEKAPYVELTAAKGGGGGQALRSEEKKARRGERRGREGGGGAASRSGSPVERKRRRGGEKKGATRRSRSRVGRDGGGGRSPPGGGPGSPPSKNNKRRRRDRSAGSP